MCNTDSNNKLFSTMAIKYKVTFHLLGINEDRKVAVPTYRRYKVYGSH